MQKFTNLIYPFLLVFMFTSCTKDNLPKESNNLAISQTTTSSNKVAIECPEFEDIQTPSGFTTQDLENYFGDFYPFFTNASRGTIDHVMACPNYALEHCDRACEQEIINFGVDYLVWGPLSSMPWVTGGVFTAAEQNDLAEAAIDLAESQAPYCPNTNVQMEPVAYDLYWDRTFCCPNDNYWVAVVVKYMAPCQYEAIILDN